jgi:hypothetical protein
MQCGYVVEGETSPGVEMSPSERARLSLEKKRRRARFKTERRPRGRLRRPFILLDILLLLAA